MGTIISKYDDIVMHMHFLLTEQELSFTIYRIIAATLSKKLPPSKGNEAHNTSISQTFVWIGVRRLSFYKSNFEWEFMILALNIWSCQQHMLSTSSKRLSQMHTYIDLIVDIPTRHMVLLHTLNLTINIIYYAFNTFWCHTVLKGR